MTDRRNSPDGKTRLRANEIGIRFQNSLTDQSSQAGLVNPIGAAGDYEDGLLAGGALEYQRLGDLPHLAADRPGGVFGAGFVPFVPGLPAGAGAAAGAVVGGSGDLPFNWVYDGRVNFMMDNLLAEGVADWRICVTGNTVIDALRRIAADPPDLRVTVLGELTETGRRVILVTGYRGGELASWFANEPRVIVAEHAGWELGMFSSIRCGAVLVNTGRRVRTGVASLSATWSPPAPQPDKARNNAAARAATTMVRFRIGKDLLVPAPGSTLGPAPNL